MVFPHVPLQRKHGKITKSLLRQKENLNNINQNLNAQLKQLDFHIHEILIFCDPYFNYSLEHFQDIIDDYNGWYNKKDIFFMGFHPLNPANEEEQEFLVTPNGDTPIVDSDLEYSMMLIQKFSQLQEASDKLHRQGYYKLWPKEYYRDVVVSRQKTYKRIFGGQNV